MTRRMLIDGNHPEEIRVVILNGNRLEDYDVETSTKTQLKGNIYLAKVTRVEPSLQAAFVEYGGNRHGFLAFSEIHPDYYQIPVEDREALKRDLAQLADNAQAAQAHVDEMDDDVGPPVRLPPEEPREETMPAAATVDRITDDHPAEPDLPAENGETAAPAEARNPEPESEPQPAGDMPESTSTDERGASPQGDLADAAEAVDGEPPTPSVEPEGDDAAPRRRGRRGNGDTDGEPSRGHGHAGGDGGRRRRPVRRYRIQEVIKRRQILLVQVVKEERGNKGAALTTYLSLAGRYCVLMPNAARVGGVSRKITSTTDRRRLRDLLNSLEVPEGMGVIMRTAGMERTKAEIKRDLDYLLRLWEDVRELTLSSTAPALVYEEGNLIKRAIRDLYARDIEEVLVEGNDAYQTAKKFMRLMMPSHAKRVKQYRDPMIPLFHRYQVETQLEAMHSPVVHLKSGGYIVINPTEALVAIDVNSGRATRERNIEETAVKTNLEAASEIARQLRLRDLAGLIVIDFIDMEENRNQRAVEKRIKESVKNDRARIQLGRISPFGLFELSRQRLRPSLIETSTEACPHCHGIGHVRSTESTAIRVLRALEEEGIRRRAAEVTIDIATPIALYILNQKRSWLGDIERRYGFSVKISGDDTLVPPDMRLERTRARTEADDVEHPIQAALEAPPIIEVDEEDEAVEEADETETVEAREPREGRSQEGGAREGGRRRRRRRRRRGDGGAETREAEARPFAEAPQQDEPTAEDAAPGQSEHRPGETDAAGQDQDERRERRRRRGRRGGRRRRGERGQEDAAARTADDAGILSGEPGEESLGRPPEDVREPVSSEAAPEPVAEIPDIPEFAVVPAPEPAREEAVEPVKATPAEQPHHGGNGTPAAEPEAAPPAPQPEVQPEPPPEEPKGPPRRGWWQRITEQRGGD